MDEIRLGALLLEGGLVDEAGLERCLAIQGLTGHTRPIGEVLVEQGLLDRDTLARVLELQRERTAARHTRVPPTDLGCASLLAAAFANGAGEIVVSEGRSVRIRVGIDWRELTDEVLSGPEVWDFVRELMGSHVLAELAEQQFVQRPWHLDGVGRGVATAFRQFDGVAVRVTFALPADATPVEVPRAVLDAVSSGRGLVLCVGERGLGRAELFKALLPVAARENGNYVVVVDDDPVDLPNTGAMVVRRRFGPDDLRRGAALRSVVREDPDAIVVADVGSPTTFELALRAAEGGRLVIAWLDAHNVVAALTRILNFYPVHDLPRVRATLAAVLRVVVVRQLLPDADHTGTAAATELLVVDDAAREAVRRGSLADAALLLRTGDGSRNHSLDQSMLDLLQAGKVRLEDVFARAEEKAFILERTRALAARTR